MYDPSKHVVHSEQRKAGGRQPAGNDIARRHPTDDRGGPGSGRGPRTHRAFPRRSGRQEGGVGDRGTFVADVCRRGALSDLLRVGSRTDRVDQKQLQGHRQRQAVSAAGQESIALGAQADPCRRRIEGRRRQHRRVAAWKRNSISISPEPEASFRRRSRKARRPRRPSRACARQQARRCWPTRSRPTWKWMQPSKKNCRRSTTISRPPMSPIPSERATA